MFSNINEFYEYLMLIKILFAFRLKSLNSDKFCFCACYMRPHRMQLYNSRPPAMCPASDASKKAGRLIAIIV